MPLLWGFSSTTNISTETLQKHSLSMIKSDYPGQPGFSQQRRKLPTTSTSELVGPSLFDGSTTKGRQEAHKQRAGFSVNRDVPTYQVEDQKKVLTIEEMNA
jgi:hypothetical protein